MPGGSILSARPPLQYQPAYTQSNMPVHHADLPWVACGLLLAAVALAALYHLAHLQQDLWDPPDQLDQDAGHEDQDQDTDQADQGPAAAVYHLPTLRHRPLVPAINLSVYTYM